MIEAIGVMLEIIATVILIYGALVAGVIVFSLVAELAHRIWGKK